jgi:spore germination cell wall hydrolase CwlJ-like protein
MKFSKTLLIISISLMIPTSGAQIKPTIAAQVSGDFNKQILCMAKNLYYEAAMESHEGKLAVAQVTINRANNKNYPSDICGVVYQKTGATCQFSWTCDSDKKEIRNRYAWEESLYIARRALTESILHHELAKSNALFYHATYVNPGWNNIKVVRQIGNHIFYAKK